MENDNQNARGGIGVCCTPADNLAMLSLNMRWCWDHGADTIWKHLDSDLWELTHNPRVVLQSVSRDRLQQVLADPVIQEKIEELLAKDDTRVNAWFHKNHTGSPLSCVAYFSMEYMLSESLPIYSGGLGNVAGDQLKAAGDLGLPIVGIGLLYQQGYFRQMLDAEGNQEAVYPYNDPGQLPVTPLKQADGEWVRWKIALPGFSVWLRAWQVLVGNVRLLLLDSNDPANYPIHRGITSELYGGGNELRLKQELILGIGGWQLLGRLGIRPEVCHLNEGHSAFVVLERAYAYMQETGHSFDIALAVTRPGNLFTTHTAVPAGFDRFPVGLMERYLGRYAQEKLGLSLAELLAFGRQNPEDATEPFNMAYLAMHGCGNANGVSRLHGEVSRRLFQSLFPRWPREEVPVGYVTNGVHMQHWDSVAADDLWTEACGKGRWRDSLETLTDDIEKVPDDRLWQMRNLTRKSLVEYTRTRLSRERADTGLSSEEVEEARRLFDPGILTLGFARRFATYKRPNLLLHDPQRLVRILTDPVRPVQLIIAGKAHPEDMAGAALIRDWFHFIRQPEVRRHVIFLSDYDMLLTENLVQGVDVWINTPRRPWEACGTSGMKVLLNGGINLSELDGWWAEAYTPEVGWALGDGQEHGDDPSWDAAEAGDLYDLLEKEVVPQFYDRDAAGIPRAWTARMRQSMALLTPQFSANRTVREYTEKYYIPAATNYKERLAMNGTLGSQMVSWRHSIEQKWAGVYFGEMKIESKGEEHHFTVQVFLNGLTPEMVSVELYANGTNGDAPWKEPMQPLSYAEESPGRWTYTAKVSASRPQTDFTPRITPHYKGVAVPLEANQILWQH